MQALQFSEFGNPAEVLKLVEIERPECGPDEVLVRVTARSVNPSDLYTIMGFYGILPTLPAVAGNEAAGIVEEVGSDVKGFKPGMRVTLLLGGVGTEGTWREFFAVKPEWLLPTPDSISDSQAASAWVNYLTAWVLSFEELDLQPDEHVLVTACASHLGRAMLQMAKIGNFKVVGTVRNAEQRQELLDQGAAGVIVTGEESIGKRWHEITGKKGIGKAIDAVAGKVATDVIAAMASRGTFISYGLMSGEPFQIDGSLIFTEATIRGFWLVKWMSNNSQGHVAEVVEQLVKYFSDGTLESQIDSEFDLSDYKKMIERSNTPGRKGKVVLISPAS